MGYIEPSSVIQLFKGINLDNRYLHTIYFANESAQNSWFTGKVNMTIQRHSYQRYGVGQIKVQGDATEFLDFTYMRFKNDRGVDMWFYAFINLVEYVNENTVLITYEIDVMQTWFIQKGSVRPCMVLREHVNDDTFGRNLEAEPVGSEQYDKTHIADANRLKDINDNYVDDIFEDFNLIVNTSADAASPDVENYNHALTRTIIDDIFHPTMILSEPVDYNDPTSFDAFHADMNRLIGNCDKGQQTNDIFDMFVFPRAFASGIKIRDQYTKSFSMPTTFDLYTPKNKKLLTYPYNFLVVTSKDGSCGQFKWELFNDVLNNDPTFELDGTILGGGNIICYPKAYNGISDDVDDKVVMNDFPKIAYLYDAYQAWVANGGKTRLQNAENINNARMFVEAMKFAGQNAKDTAYVGATATHGTWQYLRGKPQFLGDVLEGVNKVNSMQERNTLAMADMMEAHNKIAYQWKDAEYRPNVVIGTPSPSTAISFEYLNFYFIQVHVRENEAKHIDDFFSCYGYAINRVKAPNLTGRRYWNFVQTKDCVISGNMPASSKEAIARIFDGGITFWHNGDNVGNYAISTSNGSIDNPII